MDCIFAAIMAKSKQISLIPFLVAGISACIVFGFALSLFGFNALHTILSGAILLCVAFLMVYIYQNYYKQKEHGYATIGRRYWAFFLDMALFHLIGHIVLMVSLMRDGITTISFMELYGQLLGERYFILKTELIMLGGYCIYSIIMETIWGATLGMRVLQLRVYTTEGKYPSLIQSVIRNILKFIVLVPFVLILTYTMRHRLFSYYSFIELLLLVYLYPKLNRKRSYIHDDLTKLYIFDYVSGVGFSSKGKVSDSKQK